MKCPKCGNELRESKKLLAIFYVIPAKRNSARKLWTGFSLPDLSAGKNLHR